MSLEKSFGEVIEELEAKLSEGDIKLCQEKARLAEFNGVSYRSSYITVLLQKVQLNTIGERGEYEK